MRCRIDFAAARSLIALGALCGGLLATPVSAATNVAPALPPPGLPSPSALPGTSSTDPQAPCENCATVVSIQLATQQTQWTPLGSVTPGSVVPGAGGGTPAGYSTFQIGPGFQNQGLVVIGAAGGAAYGKRPNSYQRPRWDVRVRYDSGVERTLNQSYEPLFQVGDRVRVYGTQLELI
jgi:outer membrane lipoprotein SlyB